MGNTARDRSMEAGANNDEKKSEHGSEASDQRDRPQPWKLRDLRPEKDPMGAGGGTTPSADAADR